MKGFRATRILAGFLALTLPLMPVQALLLRTAPRWARTFPHWYHRRVCALLGLRLEIDGAVERDRPVLLVANHTSWLDIPVLSALAPVSFVAKKEVARWPFVSWLAKLQRTVFVDRERRTAAGRSASDIAGRLASGDTLVLFAEGTSSDGNRLLPFKSTLFAAAKPGGARPSKPDLSPPVEPPDAAARATPVVQTVTICYTHVHGVPFERADRPLVGWYGDMDMGTHAWRLLNAGPLDAKLVVGPPVALESYADRKELARQTETEIRTELVRILRGRQRCDPIPLTTLETPAQRSPALPSAKKPRNFT